MLEARENEQDHDNAPMEVKAPAGVAVVNIKKSFCPGLAAIPQIRRK